MPGARRTSLRAVAVGAATVLGLAACGTSQGGAGDQGGVSAPVAVATTTVLGSIVGDITSCAGATSATLIPVGADPHEFVASSGQVAEAVRAKLVVANGLGLEQGLGDVLDSARRDGAAVFEVAPKLDPIPFSTDGAAHADEHGAGSQDPHVWMDVARMARAAKLVGDELARVTGESRYTSCGTQVSDRLAQTDREVRQILAQVPQERRRLITDHEAFGYFDAAYGFRRIGVVVPGGSTDAQPSSEHISALVAAIRAAEVPAIFSNVAVSPALIDTVAAETGRDVKVVPLYVGSVGPKGSGADTYATMMTSNAAKIAQALR